MGPSVALRTTALVRGSGRDHEVLSAVALWAPSGSTTAPATVLCESTKVSFAPLSGEAIAAYIRSGEPMDKAGSYGIQVRRIRILGRSEA